MKKGYTMQSFSGRISGKRNLISGRTPDIKKGRISDATLCATHLVVLERLEGVLCVLGRVAQSLQVEINHP